MHTWAPTCIIQLTPAGLETPSSHSATQTALITVYVRPASPPRSTPPGCQQVPVCLEGPPLHLFPGQACNPSPVRLAQCTNLGSDPILSSPNSAQPTHFFSFFFFSHQPKKSVSHYESPTHSRALHHLHRTILAQRNRVFPRGAFGASE